MPDMLCVGHASYDVTMAVAHHPLTNEKMQADEMNLAGGGPAANAAVQIARLGGSAGFCGYLGRDIFGETHLAELIAEGVETSLVVRGDIPTPVSQVLAKPDGMRSVVNYRSKTSLLSADVLDTSQPLSSMELKSLKLMLFDGHEPALSERLCSQAHKKGVVTLLDAGSLQHGTRILADRVDVLAASETFARQWGETEDMDMALSRLAEINDCVVITLGKRGLIWQRRGERGAVPAFKINPVDSTGAGDSFHGALAYALVERMAWEEALRFAAAVAALTCTQLGARRALPNLATVKALLARG